MASLKNKAAHALSWDLLGNYGGQLTTFVISIFLARLLEPAEFGLVGMSMVFLIVLRLFMDLGFTSAIIQSKENSSLIYSSIFYVNIAFGALITLILCLIAPLVGMFYENDIITNILRLLSISFFLSSFNVVQGAILKRSLNFKMLTLRDLFSQVLAGVAAVYFAYAGFGVYALVIQQILAALIKTILLWKVTSWYPKLEFSWSEIKKLTGYSAYVLAAQSVNQFIRQADILIIGKLFSPATLGYFSRAQSVNQLISRASVSSIANVFFPALSTIQDDDERFQRIYLKVVGLVGGISLFLTGFFFLCGRELIIGLFGKKWEPSVFIFQILIIRGFCHPISSIIVSAFLAKGKAKENFKNGNLRKFFQLSPFIVAYFYGFEPYLYAVVASSLINFLLNNYFVTKFLKIPFDLQINVILPHIIATLVFTSLLYFFLPGEFSYLWAAVKVVLFVVFYGSYLYFTNATLLQELLFYKDKLWKKLLKRSGRA